MTVPTTAVPTPRAATPQVPAPRRPVDRAPATPAPRLGRHRVVGPEQARRWTVRTVRAPNASMASGLVRLAAHAGSIVTLAAMLVAAAATAGLTDGVAPTGDAASVASATLRATAPR